MRVTQVVVDCLADLQQFRRNSCWGGGSTLFHKASYMACPMVMGQMPSTICCHLEAALSHGRQDYGRTKSRASW